MNTKILLGASALVMGAAGIAATFLPQEILAALGAASVGVLPILVQLLGATLFGFAMVNWAARGSLIGGIYNRPVAIGNLAHFMIGALGLIKAVLRGQHAPSLVIAAAIYILFAIGFAMLFFRSPVAESPRS